MGAWRAKGEFSLSPLYLASLPRLFLSLSVSPEPQRHKHLFVEQRSYKEPGGELRERGDECAEQRAPRARHLLRLSENYYTPRSD